MLGKILRPNGSIVGRTRAPLREISFQLSNQIDDSGNRKMNMVIAGETVRGFICTPEAFEHLMRLQQRQAMPPLRTDTAVKRLIS